MFNLLKRMARPSLAALALALSLSIIPLPAQAGRMIWSTVDTPGIQFNVVSSPGEINFLAQSRDGRTFYSSDTSQGRLYRSDDSGVSWLEISGNLIAAGAGLPAWNISVSPDNPQFVAVVTSSGNRPRQVYVSQDGGQTWNDTAFPTAADIGALAISPYYGICDIAAGTRSGGAGDVYIYKVGGVGGAWSAQGFSGDVLSICFPSSYRADPSIAVLYSTAAGAFFNAGVHDLNANTTSWDTVFGGNPPEITVSGAGGSPKAAQIVSGCLQLTADYSGQAPALCRAYISIDAPGANSGIFRVDDAVVYQLMAAQPNRRISSIAYYGTYSGGKLLAGAVTGDAAQGTVLTWFTDTPMTCPTACWYQTEKPPTGAAASGYGNAIVMWSPDGSRAFCGTGSAMLNGPAAWPGGYLIGTPLDESAFSLSKDNGKTWNQLSLIDTQLSFLSDVAVRADSSVIYLASINDSAAGLDSIWRSGGSVTGKSWERVLCLPAARNDIILRMSNYGNDRAIFMSSRGTDDLRQSQDGGQTWKAQLPAMNVTDFSVTMIDNTRYLYVISISSMRRANASKLTPQWSQQALVTLNGCHTIFAAPNGIVVVGGDGSDNRVAASSDAGPFAVTSYLPSSGNIHAVLDYRFSDTAVIYAAGDSADSDIYYWLIGYSRDWDIMGAPSSGFRGLAQMGTLYGAAASAGGSSVDRTLYPESLGPPVIEWDMLTTGLPAGVVFTREPVSLKLSSGVNLWAIDNRPYDYTAGTGSLWTFCDCLSPSPRYSLPSPSPAQQETAPQPLPPTTPVIPAPQTETPESTLPGTSDNIQSTPATPSPKFTTPPPDTPSPAGATDNATLNLSTLFTNDIYLWICAVVAVLAIVLIVVLIANSISRRRI
ncbi:MAG: hypothetical protein JW901_08850 [Dehalococcoidia bacterium]|nr:hypothetical protein [Dehalococcoidia bacterium]